LEHRYYGCHNMSACPVKNFTDPNYLKFLSSRQALADITTFYAYIVDLYNLTAANKWITWGGSYPGMLSSWARVKFPHLIHASVASSAPVEAIFDMQGYYDTVASAYSVDNNGVGGSQACEDAIRTGHATIGKLFTTPTGRTDLASLFGRTPDWYDNYDNQGSFAGNGVAYFPAQSNDPSCRTPACDIGSICKIMTNTSLGDEVHRLAQLTKTQSTWIPTLRSPNPLAEAKKQVSLAAPPANFWGYQTCVEFAFWQTCEVSSKCFFTQGYMTVNNTDPCPSEFGISAELVQENVDQTNLYYGGRNPSATCILYPSGEVDPWASQSILKAQSAGIQTLWVPGASHHFWTHPDLPTDQPSVVQARAAIRTYVLNVLTQDCDQPSL